MAKIALNIFWTRDELQKRSKEFNETSQKCLQSWSKIQWYAFSKQTFHQTCFYLMTKGLRDGNYIKKKDAIDVGDSSD